MTYLRYRDHKAQTVRQDDPSQEDNEHCVGCILKVRQLDLLYIIEYQHAYIIQNIEDIYIV